MDNYILLFNNQINKHIHIIYFIISVVSCLNYVFHIIVFGIVYMLWRVSL